MTKIDIFSGFLGAGKTTLFRILTGEIDYDSGEVADALWEDYEIATRPGAHCAPLMHQALGTVEQGAVRFSFSWFNTEEEVDALCEALGKGIEGLVRIRK